MEKKIKIAFQNMLQNLKEREENKRIGILSYILDSGSRQERFFQMEYCYQLQKELDNKEYVVLIETDRIDCIASLKRDLKNPKDETKGHLNSFGGLSDEERAKIKLLIEFKDYNNWFAKSKPRVEGIRNDIKKLEDAKSYKNAKKFVMLFSFYVDPKGAITWLKNNFTPRSRTSERDKNKFLDIEQLKQNLNIKKDVECLNKQRFKIHSHEVILTGFLIHV